MKIPKKAFTLRARLITLSDRAYRGVYPDSSGSRLKELLEDYCAGKRWKAQIEAEVMPDEARRLRKALKAAIRGGVDVVITTGGTGMGPRDITPETVAGVAEKLVPGIMEHIRVKFGAKRPEARLSRSVAAVAGKTQIYALPGSTRAVEEYMGEILKTLEHAIHMLHGRDVHR